MKFGYLFTALGYLLGAAVLYVELKKRNLATQGLLMIALCGVIGGAVLARVSEFAFDGWPVTISLAAIWNPRYGGRSLLGGLLGGWAAVEIAKWRLGLRRSTGDAWALALPAGESVARIGCFFNGCCYGKVCSLPWAVEQHGAMRHPAQLYSAVASSAIFTVLLLVSRRGLREGDLFRMYLVLFGMSRFLLEFVREGPSLWLGLSAMQLLCIALIGCGAIGLIREPVRRTQG